MNISYCSYLILYCLNKLNGERSIYGIYHLLTGKKSSQAITDANLYHLNNLFGVQKSLSRAQVESGISELLELRLINPIDKNKYLPTKYGIELLNRKLKEKPIPSRLNGLLLGNQGELFWKRLSLLTQVISNLIHNEKNYTAIQQDESILRWVKQFLKLKKLDRFVLSRILHKEIEDALKNVTQIEATIFVMRLSSFQTIGLTYEQISNLFAEDETYIQVLFQNTIHSILEIVAQNPHQFPFLFEIVKSEQHHDLPLTISSAKTYLYISLGKSIEEIAEKRKLKRNTVEDHIVEIAHHMSDFSIDLYVPEEYQKEILVVAKQIGRKQLRPIKESVRDEITYFQIRLVLAKCGENDA